MHVVSLYDCSSKDPSSGLVYRLRKGEVWKADHPLVIARPHLFDRAAGTGVEQATKSPGEKREVKRVTR